MPVSYKWNITPTGIIGPDGERTITRLIYNLTATDGDAKGDLGAPGIAYLSKPIPPDGIAPAELAQLLEESLGPQAISLYRRIARKNLASFAGEPATVAVIGSNKNGSGRVP